MFESIKDHFKSSANKIDSLRDAILELCDNLHDEQEDLYKRLVKLERRIEVFEMKNKLLKKNVHIR